MKKLLLILFCIMLLNNSGFAQEVPNNINFLKNGNKWNFESTYYDTQITRIEYQTIENVADTLIQNKICQKLLICGNYEDKNAIDSTKTLKLREEFMYSDSDRVYRLVNDTFDVLYDFTKKTGDTLTIKTISDWNTYGDKFPCNPIEPAVLKIVIDSVENIFIEGKTLRSYYMRTISENKYCDNTLTYQPFFEGRVIEGIGCIKYLFPEIKLDWRNGLQEVLMSFLRCYYINDILVYNKKNYYYNLDCNEIYTGINNMDDKNKKIEIYPNPATDLITITGTMQGTNISIYNSQGGIVFKSLLNNNQTYLDISKFNKGLYVIVINSNKHIYTEKLLIVK